MLRALGQVLFSSGLQSPRFTTEEGQGQDYEVRTYQATKWVSTSMTGMQWDVATRTGFHRLFDYIQGNNQSKVKVEMTVPVSCRVNPGAGPACESTFTLSFYIPEEHQANPPQPSDPQVFIEDRQQLTVYVRTYGGFANEQMKLEECQKLVASLQRDGAPFREQPYYTAGYDSPMKLSNRRNEIWILKKTEHH
ncbi:heme-binding protein 2 isoform X2 [Myripristis murdjan]|uniref:Heme binding protein 2 n=2 Tax=Myripristis murdjan TaxID=586833 RepID=A0A668AC66_9TELE|nr:heme-binding protein 2-like isoform X2 [Myripristis murdjan]XP_029902810.1 heme-binding protein 2-like isoform X2 [Myripristis murdjan]XP_029902811.1 heme-binding protein 2-like isoform X2 [Myripristis murdjan]XP_029902812.1 heme-binding protein 2-like isoform X2 [Myripristis murdjan]XP_029902814.1 heme-binding protein 2-like isoform X2 [Myripristis murdjan]